ncbi:UrcA family protein [Qipengyuania soli]|uniref:UrcA family protein n=1 Tax=Qipengyuania soli TaxID=2782568 RepID=A0A7S8F406_9SPHN|nr:UrcA family protein [Qipengyuania soli]QPC98723.1 UrcA family protein [Qipengyuania soli]
MKSPIIALAAASLAISASPSAAREMRVAYRDLDLSHVEGQAALDTRVRSAARVVCGYGTSNMRSISSRADKHRCYRAAMERARSNIAAVTEQRTSGG